MPKKKSAPDTKKPGIERFFTVKKRSPTHGESTIVSSAGDLSRTKSGSVDTKKKSSRGNENYLSNRKHPPPKDEATELFPLQDSAAKKMMTNQRSKRRHPEDGSTESPSKGELFPAQASAAKKRKKTNQRQKSMQAMGFGKITSPKKKSMPDKVKQRVEQGIEQRLFERDAITVPTNLVETLIQPVLSKAPLNAEQERVVKCPPNIPLSVRACAGTGKTHTMVQRAISFVNDHGINPKNILIVTFSKLATEEVIERVSRVFVGRETDLPTIKTFHSLAYSWVCRSWRFCGLGQRPSVLSSTAGKMALMKQVFELILDKKRLERCARKLKLEEESSSWDDVLKVYEKRHEEAYDEMSDKANEEAERTIKKSKEKKDATPEEVGAIQDEVKAKRKFLLRKMCYLNLFGKENCDLERQLIGDKEKCNKRCREYLELVEKARLGGHDYSEYPFEDSQVWQMYDQQQIVTGRIDFDTMLQLFAVNVLGDKRLAKQFHERYTHVVVDEYQDNSQMQALMLRKIVEKGCLTVVGDDDQCIYEFRGASPGNFDRLKEEFAKKNISVQEEVLIDNHRSSENILTVASSFLEGDTRRHPKSLRSTKPKGLPVEVWECPSQAKQAKEIVTGMIRRHDNDQVPWKDMAVLFRSQKMGHIGSLTMHLQKELAEQKVPFCVVGGKSIFERASVRDLVAYLQLSIRSSPNDEAFTRSINQPPRKLPKEKVIPIINEFLDCNTMRKGKEGDELTPITFLQDAAKAMVEKNVGLTTPHHKALSGFLAQIGTYQEKLNILPLPDLLKYLWKETGLSERYRNKGKASNDDGSEDSDDEDQDVKVKGKENDEVDSNTSVAVKPALLKSAVTSPITVLSKNQNRVEDVYYPEEITLLIDLAAQHVDDWKKREKILRDPKSFPSLDELSRKVILENMAT